MNKQLLILLGAIALFSTAIFVFKMRVPKPTFGLSQDVIESYKAYKAQYGINFSDPDYEAYRINVYAQNLKKIESHQGGSYTLGVNQFMLLTAEEFIDIYCSGLLTPDQVSTNLHMNSGMAAKDIDWRDKGAVQKVKDQGQCGSCWAFSAVGALESDDKIQLGKLGNFSEQQLVDCSKSYGNQGCNGGLMDYAFKYVKDKGISTELLYPYKAVDQNCKKDGGTFKISKFTDVPKGQCDNLEDALQKQPIAIGVDAQQWQFYSGGVFSNCGTQLDHGVLLVGMKTDNYWIVKNSWGASWGEQGYIRLKMGNTCGICNTASYPSQ